MYILCIFLFLSGRVNGVIIITNLFFFFVITHQRCSDDFIHPHKFYYLSAWYCNVKCHFKARVNVCTHYPWWLPKYLYSFSYFKSIYTGCLQINGAVSKVNKKEGPAPIASCTVSNIAAYATPYTPLFLSSPIPCLLYPMTCGDFAETPRALFQRH